MKNRKLFALAAALLVMLLVATGAMADSASKAITNAKNGTVQVVQVFDMESGELEMASGTAFFVGKSVKNPEYLVTCAHCIDFYLAGNRGNDWVYLGDQQNPLIGKFGLRIYYDKNDYEEVYYVDHDEVLDIAILKIAEPTNKRVALKLEAATEDMVGEDAIAIGFPGSAELKDTISTKGINDLTVTKGAISKLLRNSNTGCREVQTDAKISEGNSGGPLINSKGNVIGVNANLMNSSQITLPDEGLVVDRYGNLLVNIKIREENYAVNIIEAMEMLNKNNIEYMTGGDFPILIVIGMVVVVAILVAAILLVIKKQPSSGGKKGSVGGRMLVFERGALAGQTFELKRNQKVVIGRGSDCQIRFPGDTAGVSKVHCTVTFDGQTVTIRDENSTAGTYIDEQKMKPGVAVTLHRGHPVGLGSKAQIMTLRSKK